MRFADIVSCLGLFQGVVLGLLICVAHRPDRPTRLLGYFMLTISLRVIPFLLIRIPFGARYPDIVWVPFYFYYLTMPLLYLYSRNLTGMLYWRRDYVHLVPGLIEFALLSIVFLYALATEGPLVDAATANNIIGTHSIIAIAYLVGYGFLTLRFVEQHQQHIRSFYSNLTNKRLHWIRNTVVALFSLAASYTLLRYGPLPTSPPVLTIFGAVANTLIIYYVTLNGVRQLRLKPLHQSYATPPETADVQLSPPDEGEKDYGPTYTRVHQLVKERRTYLNPNLTLADVAELTQMSERSLSRVISAASEQHFNGFINQLRVEAAQELLANPRFDHYTMEGIAMEVGFNSKGTFYRAFKQVTGESPAVYRRSTRRKSVV